MMRKTKQRSHMNPLVLYESSLWWKSNNLYTGQVWVFCEMEFGTDVQILHG